MYNSKRIGKIYQLKAGNYVFPAFLLRIVSGANIQLLSCPAKNTSLHLLTGIINNIKKKKYGHFKIY